MRLWGLLVVCPLAACVPDALAQPMPPRRDAGRPADRPPSAAWFSARNHATGGVGVGGLLSRPTAGTYVVAQRVDAGAAGALSREAIREAVRARMRDVQRCYEAGLAFDRNLAGRITVEITLDAQGAVTATSVVEDGLDRPQVGECIAEVAQRWAFPAPGGVFRFRYPFHLRAE